ncbi:putative DNA-binding protein ESCAROLA, partial [Trifolium medium]|nr:putative DNA-binding protein ESCAROLA [Trifolium medium]
MILREAKSPTVTTQVQHQTQNTNTTIVNNLHTSPSVVSLRPQGRPPGTKNKPKVSVMVPHDDPNVLRYEMLKVAHGVTFVAKGGPYTSSVQMDGWNKSHF